MPAFDMMRTAIFHSQYEDLDEIRQFVSRAAQDMGMDESETYQVALAVDEACSNVIEHGCQGRCDEEIEITCSDENDCLTILIRDHGSPFDPGSAPTPDLSKDINQRQVGGLGIFLMRRLMDDIHYERLGEAGNVLTLVKRRKQEA